MNALGQDTFDAVIFITALHWLTPPEIARVYRQLAGLLRPGSVLLNGNLLPLPGQLSPDPGRCHPTRPRPRRSGLERLWW